MDDVFTPGADKQTRHVVVTTQAFITHWAGGVHRFAVPLGVVTWVGMLGQTQIEYIGPPMPRDPSGALRGALIEHETAEIGDILPPDVIAAGIALAAAKQKAVADAIAARKEAEKAKQLEDAKLLAKVLAEAKAKANQASSS